jgi:hypothetical protein
MSLFYSPKPRRFRHPYIYVDERKERLDAIERKARGDLGMLKDDDYDAGRLHGVFTDGVHHKHLSTRNAVIAVVILILIWFLIIH